MTSLINKAVFRLKNFMHVRYDCLILSNVRTCSNSPVTVKDLEIDALETEVDEDEIERKRNKNRLPERVYRVFVQKESEKPIFKTHFRKKSLRKFYGRYGSESGLNPGLMWPTKEELQDLLEYDRICYPPFEELVTKVKEEKAEKERRKKEYEEEVDRNMEKYEQVIKDYYAKIEKKEREAREAQEKRQLLIEEIGDYLGYEVDPKDPRFKEAVDQREREKKKVKRKLKEEQDYQKMLQKLADIAEKPEEE